MIPTNTIRALPLIASMLGNKLGVKVDIGNRENACTDGNTIYFPSLPVDTDDKCFFRASCFEFRHIP